MKIKTEQNHPIKEALEAFELHDSVGNTCAAAIWQIGPRLFELYLWDFNSSVPGRTVGNLAMVKNKMQVFYDCKVAAGFQEQTVNEHRDSIN